MWSAWFQDAWDTLEDWELIQFIACFIGWHKPSKAALQPVELRHLGDAFRAASEGRFLQMRAQFSKAVDESPFPGPPPTFRRTVFLPPRKRPDVPRFESIQEGIHWIASFIRWHRRVGFSISPAQSAEFLRAFSAAADGDLSLMRDMIQLAFTDSRFFKWSTAKDWFPRWVAGSTS